MWVLGWSAPKRLPQPFVEPSSWPSCQSSPSGEAIGVTKSASPTPCPARSLAAVDLSWCVSSRPPVVLASCQPLCPKSCSWWLVLMTATPRLGAALLRLETLVSTFWIPGKFESLILLALLSFTSVVVELSFSGERKNEFLHDGKMLLWSSLFPFLHQHFSLKN